MKKRDVIEWLMERLLEKEGAYMDAEDRRNEDKMIEVEDQINQLDDAIHILKKIL